MGRFHVEHAWWRWNHEVLYGISLTNLTEHLSSVIFVKLSWSAIVAQWASDERTCWEDIWQKKASGCRLSNSFCLIHRHHSTRLQPILLPNNDDRRTELLCFVWSSSLRAKMLFKVKNWASLEIFRVFCLHFTYGIRAQRSCYWVKGKVWAPLLRDRTWNRFPLSNDHDGTRRRPILTPMAKMYMFKYSWLQRMYVGLWRNFQFHFANAGQKLSWKGNHVGLLCLVLSLFLPEIVHLPKGKL